MSEARMTEYPRLKGLTVEEAMKVIPDGMTIRRVRVDGKHAICTRDFRTDRINVAVRDGVIEEVVSIG